MPKKVLVSWVGITDINMIASPDAFGPLESVMNADLFDIVYALTDKPDSEMKAYFTALSEKHKSIVNPVFVKLRDPTHYGDISEAMST
jgi:hypothetical protein